MGFLRGSWASSVVRCVPLPAEAPMHTASHISKQMEGSLGQGFMSAGIVSKEFPWIFLISPFDSPISSDFHVCFGYFMHAKRVK